MELFNKRASCRKFESTPVPKDVIMECLEAARLSPSYHNIQPWNFIVIDEPEKIKEVADILVDPEAKINRFAYDVPVFVAITTEVCPIPGHEEERKYTYAEFDCALATYSFCLAATEKELGTCMIGWYDQDKLKKCLAVPEDKSLPIIVAVGYPVYKEPRPKMRRPLEDMVYFNEMK
jgi:nitroreductase